MINRLKIKAIFHAKIYIDTLFLIYREGKINRAKHVPITPERWGGHNFNVKFREINESSLGF